MNNYLFDPDFLAQKTADTKKALAVNEPNANFTEFAAGVIYERLKNNIERYRVYGVYWWALKDVLRRQGYDVGDETDVNMANCYKGATDDETIVAADMFYLDMSNKVPVDNTRWTIDNRRPDFVLYDADMEKRSSITESTFDD